MNSGLKNVFIVIFAAVFFLSGCAQTTSPDINIINADNIDGFVFEYTKEIETMTDTDRTNDIGVETETSIETIDEGVGTADSLEPTTTQTDKLPETTTTPKTSTATKQTTTETKPTAPQTTTTPQITPQITTTPQTTQTTTTKTTTNQITTSDYRPLNYEKVSGVWISYLELNPILNGKSENEFRLGFKKMMQNCKNFGINTVYVHLRAFGDAFYKSDLYPWSKYITGKLGTAPNFDPLKIMLEEAHSLDISFQGWLNPLRIQSNSDISLVSENYKIGSWYKENKDHISRVGDLWYLNPAYSDVTKLIADGAAEIVLNYNIDGLHIDDYFYPTTEADFDKTAFKKSGSLSLSDFRFDNCNKLVKTLYKAIKQANPKVLFGISPQGSIENNLNLLYADVELWCTESGYLDYVAPQIYYGFENTLQPYETCLSRWQELVSGTSVRLIPGLAVYKIGKEDTWAGSGKNEWISNNNILKRQIDFASKTKNHGGIIFYSYNYMFNSDYLTTAIKNELSLLT